MGFYYFTKPLAYMTLALGATIMDFSSGPAFAPSRHDIVSLCHRCQQSAAYRQPFSSTATKTMFAQRLYVLILLQKTAVALARHVFCQPPFSAARSKRDTTERQCGMILHSAFRNSILQLNFAAPFRSTISQLNFATHFLVVAG